MAGDGKTPGGAQPLSRGPRGCSVDGCDRPLFAQGLCGFHALLGFYRTVAAPETGLSARRVARPPRLLGDAGSRPTASPVGAPGRPARPSR
jgi:hypothetical protein